MLTEAAVGQPRVEFAQLAGPQKQVGPPREET